MNKDLRIGEYASLGAKPYFFPLKNIFSEPNWIFLPGSNEDVDLALDQGEVDVALASPLAVTSAPVDFLVFRDFGYSAKRHVSDMLLFSDILLDDMEEMTISIQEGASPASALLHIILERYLQYQNNFINGWGSADAFLLSGDAALRERVLDRYAYVYDVGNLWKHYTGRSMAYLLWVVRREAFNRKKDQIVRFRNLLKQALSVSSGDWSRLAVLLDGYDWIKKPMMTQLWKRIEYNLDESHFEGLNYFYDDCVEIGLIEDVPELEFVEDLL